jgi:hypothetical protein
LGIPAAEVWARMRGVEEEASLMYGVCALGIHIHLIFGASRSPLSVHLLLVLKCREMAAHATWVITTYNSTYYQCRETVMRIQVPVLRTLATTIHMAGWGPYHPCSPCVPARGRALIGDQ